MAASGVPQFASLYVGDLNPDITEAMLYEIFNSVGPVASIRVCRDSVTRRSLGYGYINFHSVSDAERALDTLNYSSIKGRSCRIMWSQRDPSLRKSGAGNIHVKNLDLNIDNKALYDTFSLFGNILSCKVASDAHGKSYGYGFVHYETEEAAKQAIERVNGMQIGEKTVQVCEFVRRNERQDADNFTNLYVKNVPEDWDYEKINAEFQVFGTVTSTGLRTDAQGRRAAFVNFEKSDDAKRCVEEMHRKDMRSEEQKAKDKEEGKEDEAGADGHPSHLLYVQRAQTKAERQAELRDKFNTDPDGKSQQGVNLYIKNLDDTMTDVELRELFEPFGTVSSVSAPRDDKGKGKGFGFVCFSHPDEATKAVTEMHLKVIRGKPLYVGLAERREQRQERLRQRYSAGAASMGGKGGKGGAPKGMPPQMYGGPQGMPPQMMGMMGMPGMMRPPAMMMGSPQMMQQQMMQKGMMAKGMPMMMGKGPQMMPPQMMGKGMVGMPMMGMPGMRPPMPQQQQQQQQQPRPQAQAPPQQAAANAPINPAALASAPPAVQKQMIGEKLYPLIARLQPELSGKITGMMLEMDNSELLMLLDSEAQLKSKVDDAMRVLGEK